MQKHRKNYLKMIALTSSMAVWYDTPQFLLKRTVGAFCEGTSTVLWCTLFECTGMY